jgi:hypothetical protein
MSRHALIVGINQYPRLNSLSLPAKDAQAIAQLLETQGEFRITRLAETVINEQITINPNAQISLSQLKKALLQLFKPNSEQIPDVALFYFAGHGVRDNDGLDESFLATSDINLENVWGLSLRWLRDLLQQSPIKTQIVWLDCCYSGGLINFNEADPSDKGLARNRCFITASRAFEVAYEEVAGNHGVLTQVLLQGLDCTHQTSVTNLALTEFINTQLKTTTQAPMALNSGEAIELTFNRHQQKPLATINQDKPCPYKGLFYFDCNQTDALNFYGREQLTDELLAHSREHNFLAVLGASGSGKSSVIRAGLLYQLQAGLKNSHSSAWQQFIITPTDEPLQSLAYAFVDKTANDIEQARQLKTALSLLNDGAQGLKTLIAIKNTKVVLFVDQFEELFTLCTNETKRLDFLGCILPLDLLRHSFN